MSRWYPLPEAFRTVAAQHRGSVLLETAKPSGGADQSLLFLHPVKELTAQRADELDEVLQAVDRHLAEGLFVAGSFHYECGEHFVGLSADRAFDEPIVWLGVFEQPIRFDHTTGDTQGSLPFVPEDVVDDVPAVIHSDGLEISQAEYSARIAQVQEYLHAGHSYQVNFTDRITGYVEATPLAVYRSLLRQQPVSYAAYVHAPAGIALSFSPEMFYRTGHGRVSVRPMKGTWPRGVDEESDREAERLLLHDEKNRSEHVTIVDLLRNDVGRICKAGSVVAEKLFSVERYSTLLQMTSTISGTLVDEISPSEVFRSLFPSGSITGAPKRRTMEIIRELESQRRGLYTGSIGYFGPGGEACFNVAIRTLVLKGERFVLGVGGGITADSRAEDEYEECRLKGAFLTRRRPDFSLLETMRCVGGIPLVGLHMERLASSARYFGILYDAAALEAELMDIALGCGDAETRIRLELHPSGAWTISASPLQTMPWNGRLLLAAERTDSRDLLLHHKSTNRAFYDDALRAAQQAGFDEVLSMNERAQMTEGAISNIFLSIRGRWFTPALGCGVLSGIERGVLLQRLSGAEEAELSLEDLKQAEEIFVCNALRGVRPVRSIETADGTAIWKQELKGNAASRTPFG